MRATKLSNRLVKFEAALRQDDLEVLVRAAHACRMVAFEIIEDVRAREERRKKELQPA